jgi:hypothetical protein
MNDQVILFLDDNAHRAALAYQRMPEEERDCTIWVTTAEQAIDVLKNYKSRLIKVYLDHDLGGKTFVDSRREDTGMECVRFLERQNHNDYKNVKFVVHSWNIYAGNKMCERLKIKGYNVVYIPFGS